MGAPPQLRRVAPAEYELPVGSREGMRLPARIFGSEKLVQQMDDQVFAQAANVARLPGIGFDINCGMRTRAHEPVLSRDRA